MHVHCNNPKLTSDLVTSTFNQTIYNIKLSYYKTYNTWYMLMLGVYITPLGHQILLPRGLESKIPLQNPPMEVKLYLIQLIIQLTTTEGGAPEILR